MSSSFNLLQLNLWLGLAKGDRALPRDLFELGYRDEAIERRFPNGDMEFVCPELILASRTLGHALVFEFKSGPNTEDDQLERYGGTRSEDLQRAYVSPESSRTHDVVVIGKHEYEDRLLIGIRAGHHPFPVLLADDDGLRCALNEFRDERTDAILNPRFDIDWAVVPTSYVPFDQDSDAWEVAEIVIPEILGAMLRRERRVEFDQVCQNLTPWGIIGRPGRQQLVAKVSSVLHDTAEHEFSQYFDCDNTGVRIERNPLDLRSDKRTSAYKKLQRRQKALVDRLREGGGQLQLVLDE